ncbi:MAG: pentapeptide repeat-containing protein [Cyanobacteria bacterium SBLK]|nr:pentapeptide repeat-containing protein [Cyanobacteria bacterium SBLK]
MADEEQLAILRRGVDEWNAWRLENRSVLVDLSSADFRDVNLNGVNLIGAKLIGVNFSEAELIGAKLIGANLSSAKLSDANLSSAKLSDANLSSAKLSDANLSDANLSSANLEDIDLSRTKALNTNFWGATLTGACIEDWNINTKTNLDRVNCEYVYLGSEHDFRNRERTYTDRHPSDLNKTFVPGDFTRLIQKSLEIADLVFRGEIDWQKPSKILDLYFQDGIDWQAFANSIKCMTDDDTFLDIEGIDQTDDGILIRVKIPQNTNKEEIKREFWGKYKAELKRLEGVYRERLQAKDSQIEQYKRENTNLTDIVKAIASRPININNRNITISDNEIKGTAYTEELKGSGYTEGDNTTNTGE